ncbi:jg11436 [Pararge aegeria aegeria]|uniref:Jg11436 protein n=1 Tax=Pararge aegeria aegeria TaxID=348720 RepID=A0A8S4RYM7_9NEOP|nr:jg11436 [Pararge aegeria aegeria]
MRMYALGARAASGRRSQPVGPHAPPPAPAPIPDTRTHPKTHPKSRAPKLTFNKQKANFRPFPKQSYSNMNMQGLHICPKRAQFGLYWVELKTVFAAKGRWNAPELPGLAIITAGYNNNIY